MYYSTHTLGNIQYNSWFGMVQNYSFWHEITDRDFKMPTAVFFFSYGTKSSILCKMFNKNIAHGSSEFYSSFLHSTWWYDEISVGKYILKMTSYRNLTSAVISKTTTSAPIHPSIFPSIHYFILYMGF